MPPVASADRPKKPRNRHSPAQLAALNELYERDEHPALEVRTSLAEQLGMETKTVNSWFQNKRASTKKRTLTVKAFSQDPPRSNLSRPLNSSSTSTSSSTPRPSESGDYLDDDYPDSHSQRSLHHSYDDTPSWPTHPLVDSDRPSFLPGNDTPSPRERQRPTTEQTDVLRKVFMVNPTPSIDERQTLAESTGMPYQFVTDWFQNEHATFTVQKHDDGDAKLSPPSMQSDETVENRAYIAFPPPSKHPSLGLPPSSHHPSLGLPRPQRSPSVHSSIPDEPSPSSKRSSRRSDTPYSMSSRLRRARPEPYQLDALKDLFMKNPTPTIEQRSALALEIGMDLGKVTNWFRNLRQTSRRRAKKVGDDDDEYGYPYPHRSTPGANSRSASPSTESSLVDEAMEQDFDEDSHMAGPHSDAGSDEEYQEAVTPSPPPSPMPSKTEVPRHRLDLNSLSALALDYAEGEKAAMKFSSGIKFEDALLLVSFSQQYVR